MSEKVKQANKKLYKELVVIYLKSIGLVFLTIPIIFSVCIAFDLQDSDARALMEFMTGLFIGFGYANPRVKKSMLEYVAATKDIKK